MWEVAVLGAWMVIVFVVVSDVQVYVTPSTSQSKVKGNKASELEGNLIRIIS